MHWLSVLINLRLTYQNLKITIIQKGYEYKKTAAYNVFIILVTQVIDN